MAQAPIRPAKDERTAKELYLEQWADMYTTNNYLKLVAATLALSNVLLGGGVVWALRAMAHPKMFIVRVDDIGRTQDVTEVNTTFVPQERELKYFLLNFTKLHHRRIRATLREDFETSLYFLDGPLATAALEVQRRSRALETFLADRSPEVDVTVSNVALQDLKGPTYRAVVNYEKVYLDPNDHRELKREKYIGHVAFVVKDAVPVRLIPKNPLGLTIVDLREDPGFENR